MVTHSSLIYYLSSLWYVPLVMLWRCSIQSVTKRACQLPKDYSEHWDGLQDGRHVCMYVFIFFSFCFFLLFNSGWNSFLVHYCPYLVELWIRMVTLTPLTYALAIVWQSHIFFIWLHALNCNICDVSGQIHVVQHPYYHLWLRVGQMEILTIYVVYISPLVMTTICSAFSWESYVCVCCHHQCV